MCSGQTELNESQCTEKEPTTSERASKQTNIRNPYKWALTSLKNSSHLIGQSRKRGYNTAVQSSDTK